MATTGQHFPVARAAEVLGDRSATLIVRCRPHIGAVASGSAVVTVRFVVRPPTTRERGCTTADSFVPGTNCDGCGYLLKDRVLEIEEFLQTAGRVAAGGSALGPHRRGDTDYLGYRKRPRTALRR